MWVPPAKLKAFCKLDLRYWPMDKQRCFMKFASWTAHGGQIKLDLYNEKENDLYNIYIITKNMIKRTLIVIHNYPIIDFLQR